MYSVTQAFVEWLGGLGYSASTYPAKDAPDEFVTVERTGGYVADMVDHPVVAIQTWAESEARAEEMANAVRNALATGDRPHGVTAATVDMGPYPYWDEYTGKPRYQTVYQAHCQLVQ